MTSEYVYYVNHISVRKPAVTRFPHFLRRYRVYIVYTFARKPHNHALLTLFPLIDVHRPLSPVIHRLYSTDPVSLAAYPR